MCSRAGHYLFQLARMRNSPTFDDSQIGERAKAFEASLQPSGQLAQRRKQKSPFRGCFVLAEKAGFEPAVGY